jgi:hypothetical protein
MAGWINRRFNLREVSIPPPSYGDYQLYALDERWALDFLRDRDIDAPLREILADDQEFGVFSVQVRPETMTLLLRTGLSNLSPDNLQRWLAAFDRMVDTATRLHPPSQPVNASGWERWSQKNRHLVVWVGVAAFFGVVGLVIGLGMVACFLFLLLANQL